MKRIALQILLALGGLLMFFRFGGPALIFGATGPGPFGNRWLAVGTTATLLLDADLRFCHDARTWCDLLLDDCENRNVKCGGFFPLCACRRRPR